jgi:hypothetical protein
MLLDNPLCHYADDLFLGKVSPLTFKSHLYGSSRIGLRIFIASFSLHSPNQEKQEMKVSMALASNNESPCGHCM